MILTRQFNVGVFESRLKAWLIKVEAEIQQEVQSSDSASQLTKVTNLSKKISRLSQASSKRISISAARIKETARMAEINAEIKALKQKQALLQKDLKLKEEKMKLSFQMEELNLGTELAKVKTKEQICAEAETESELLESSAWNIDLEKTTRELPEEQPRDASKVEMILEARKDNKLYEKLVKDMSRHPREQPV